MSKIVFSELHFQCALAYVVCYCFFKNFICFCTFCLSLSLSFTPLSLSLARTFSLLVSFSSSTPCLNSLSLSFYVLLFVFFAAADVFSFSFCSFTSLKCRFLPLE